MFSLKVIDTDAFLEMPVSTQALYFHLAMRADDDGFVSNPRRIARMLGTADDDYKVLVAKKFVIPFENGVCVIKHWRIHNMIRSDRYSETQWVEEKSTLHIDPKTSKYTTKSPNVIPDGNQLAPQVRLGKVRVGKNSKDKYGEFENVFLSVEEHQKLVSRYGRSAINTLIEECSTYQKSAGKKYSDHYATLLNWAKRKGLVEVPKPTAKPIPEVPLTSEQIKRNEELRAQIRETLPGTRLLAK